MSRFMSTTEPGVCGLLCRFLSVALWPDRVSGLDQEYDRQLNDTILSGWKSWPLRLSYHAS
eukprot:scaffold243338_cov31-Tisochrysis_lutea.AAC.7